MLFPNTCQKVKTRDFEREIGFGFLLWVCFWVLFLSPCNDILRLNAEPGYERWFYFKNIIGFKVR